MAWSGGEFHHYETSLRGLGTPRACRSVDSAGQAQTTCYKPKPCVTVGSAHDTGITFGESENGVFVHSSHLHQLWANDADRPLSTVALWVPTKMQSRSPVLLQYLWLVASLMVTVT